MAPIPRKAFRNPVVKPPKARSEQKKRGNNTIKAEFCANIILKIEVTNTD